MKPIVFSAGLIFFLVQSFFSFSQTLSSNAMAWRGKWIAVPDQPKQGYGVYLFRKQFHLEAKPQSFNVQVSADNRYKLYVNGKLVSLGPARGDLYFWNYETVDLASHLQVGKNIIAALVWNEGEYRPEAQLTFQTGFILNGVSPETAIVDTNPSWKCFHQSSYQPVAVKLNAYYVAGAGEFVDMNSHIMDWEKPEFDDSGWLAAEVIGNGLPKGVFQFDYRWMLVPSSIPPMVMNVERFSSTRRASEVVVPPEFPASKVSIEIPAKTKAKILLDQSYLTNAYFNLAWSKGKNAIMKIIYAECLVGKNGVKGNRNDVENKNMVGREDWIISSGKQGQTFCTLWWRTFRYVELSIETKEEPLVLEDVFGIYTGYPFIYKASFVSNNTDLLNNLDIGWRTAKLCAVETYMDCPYYEQLQYIGDTRIQALVSYYSSGDNRLAKNALNMMEHSMISEGLTLSRHPSYTPQIIPTFSLWYVHMLHDFWMYNDDENFVKEKVASTRSVLNFFARYQEKDGSLKNLPYWIFTDWVESAGWKEGIAPIGMDGSSSVLDLQLLWTYQVAIELEDRLGMKEIAAVYKERAEQLSKTIRAKYWDETKKLFADTSEKKLFSQHANALAILCGIISGMDAKYLASNMLDGVMAEASIYFKYYLHQAAIKAGLGEKYLTWLSKWNENISLGLTTWAEMSDVKKSRSDCHAWGSSPNIEIYRTVLGIDSSSPGFKSIKIEPSFDFSFNQVSGSIPHPNGKVSVKYVRTGSGWSITIDLPENISGAFIWKGESHPLTPGKNQLDI